MRVPIQRIVPVPNNRTDQTTMFQQKKRQTAGRANRGGYVLILVVLLLFGIMAMAALVIDIGLARLTQRQMQTAVDGASLEGLRYRDSLWPEATGTDKDVERRNAASLTAARMFDDNLLADDDDPWNFGAGPIVEFSGGAGAPDFVASQFMTIPDPPVYKPNGTHKLRNNLTNVPAGDMLDGVYAMSPDPTASSEEIRDFHIEENDYSRKDFPTPATSISPSYPAFLVRMRRSNESFAGSDTASNGPALPYLFARGSLFNRSNDPTQAKLSNGIQVRATGISHAQPVVCLGANHPLFLEIAIDIDQWDVGAPVSWTATHVVSDGIVGEVANNPSMGTPPNRSGYVALYSTAAFNRVIGFGYASVDSVFSTVTKLPFDKTVTQIATENASAVFCRPLDSSIPSNELSLVFQERTNRLVKATRNDILLAPVSGR